MVVTGTSVGIGLEFVRQYAAAGATVHALCRNPAQATELQAVADDSAAGLIRVHEYDQTNEASVRALQLRFAGVPVDILINNAAAGGSGPTRSDYAVEGQSYGEIDYAAWADTMNTNVFGVMRTTEALVPSLLLTTRPKLVQVGEPRSLHLALFIITIWHYLRCANNSHCMFTYSAATNPLHAVSCPLPLVASPIKCGRVILRRICSRRFRVTPKGAVAPKDSSCTVSVKWIPVCTALFATVLKLLDFTIRF